MKVKRQWMEEMMVMDAVVEALDQSEELEANAWSERDLSYGDDGTIVIKLVNGDGRKFALELHELI